MAEGLQAAGTSAFSRLPYAMQRIGMPKILPANGQGSSEMRAGVEDGNPVSPVFVKDQANFDNPDYAPQLLRHEQTHRITANWPAPLQKMLPPINPSDPYNYGGAAGIQKINSNPLKLSEEQMAAAEQKIQQLEQNKEPIPAPLKKLDQNFQAIPLSVMQPTDPHGKGINTMPRSPGLPAGYDPKSGKILQANNVLPVKPGSGQELPPGWSTTAPQEDELPAGWSSHAPEAKPTATIGPGKPESWLHQLEGDLTYGGNETLPGRVLGYMQGRGSKGYSGMGEGPNGVGAIPASPEMGLLHAFEGAQEMGSHPLRGAWDTVKGALEAGQIPMAFMGGPAADGAIEAIPTRAKAGRLFEDVMSKAADQPVTLSPQTLEPLERTQQLAMAGGKPFGTADKLFQRISQTQPLTYREARDFASNMALSPEERMGLKKSMQYEVPRLSHAFNEDVGRAAESAGKGSEYRQAMSTYRRAARNRDLAIKGAKYIGIPAASGAVGKAIFDKLRLSH